MPQLLTVGVAQVFTQPTLQETLAALKQTTQRAASQGVSILLFPEAYLGGYPRTCSFGAAVGSRTDAGREQYLQYFKGAVDLGDTPLGAGEDWLERKLDVNKDTGRRGDGTREYLENVARDTGVFIVTGLVEKSGGSLFCAALYIDPKRGVLGKRRKLMPTGSERLVWAQGSASTLKAVTATVKGVKLTMGCAICWENMMPLLRYSLYAQNVNLWLAPTADARDTWEPLMRTVAAEGRCFVLTGNQCQRRSQLPSWITGSDETTSSSSGQQREQASSSPPKVRRKSVATRTDDNHEIALPIKNAQVNGDVESSSSSPLASTALAATDDTSDEFVSRGGSCIISPMGKVLKGPIWEQTEEILTAEVDFEDCARGKLDFDAAGHYSRPDAFQLKVTGLDLNPPA